MHLPQRRRYLVSRSQAHLLAFQAVYYGLFLVVLSIGLFGPLVLELSQEEGGVDGVGVARVMLYMHARYWLLAGLMVAIALVHAVFLTHRVVGPLVRFRRVFRDVAAGRLQHHLVLRQRDYLTDEAADLNAMTASLAARVRALRATHGRALEELGELERSLPAADPLDALRLRLDELGAELAWFDCNADEARERRDVERPPSLVADPPRPVPRTAERP
jgi:HAMP domain-containing protein